MSEKLLSVVCPCYNEASCINAFVDAIWDAIPQGQAYEVVFVDDGSTDETLDLIKSSVKRGIQGGGAAAIYFILQKLRKRVGALGRFEGCKR